MTTFTKDDVRHVIEAHTAKYGEADYLRRVTMAYYAYGNSAKDLLDMVFSDSPPTLLTKDELVDLMWETWGTIGDTSITNVVDDLLCMLGGYDDLVITSGQTILS